MDKKNTMLLTVIAVATLLVAVVGATFAYFSITSDTSRDTSANVEVASAGTITITSGDGLKLGLSALEMDKANQGTTYWAVDGTTASTAPQFGTTQYKASVVRIGLSGAAAGQQYTCTGKVTVTATGDLAASTSEDLDIIIEGASTEDDDGTYTAAGIASKVFNLSYTLTGATDSAEVKASISLTNTNAEQNAAFADKSLTLTFTPSEFVCNAVAGS